MTGNLPKSNKHTVLVIDDEKENRDLLGKILTINNFDVITAANGEEGVLIAKQIIPTIILLDVQMPKMDGIEACQLLRKHESTTHIPVIMLSGVLDQDQQNKTFSFGADDFVEKPYKTTNLIARIKSKILRIEEAKKKEPKLLQCADVTLNLDSLEVIVNNSVIKLSHLEFKLLKYFIDHKNTALTRERILAYVWAGVKVTSRCVDTAVCVLKSKLAESSLDFESIYAKGYILRLDEESEKEAA
jgi:DNA-binding response OmpR family regulator